MSTPDTAAKASRAIAALRGSMPRWGWATVTTLDPITVTFDDTTTAVPVADSLVPSLIVGERVEVRRTGMLGARRVITARAVADTGWLPFTAYDSDWDVSGTGNYRKLSARRVGNLVLIEGVATYVPGGAPPAGDLCAVLPTGIPAPDKRIPLTDPRPDKSQGEISLGTGTGTHLDKVYLYSTRGTDPNLLLTGQYFISTT